MSFIYNGRPMGYGYPFPLYFFMTADRKITPEQLKANLRRVVERFVTAAVNENNKKTGGDHKNNNILNSEVKDNVNKAIMELLNEIVDAKISVTTSTTNTTSSKVFNLGSYVNDMNGELNQMINDAFPL